MSENQQPLDEEQAVSDVQEQETLPAAAEETPPAAQDENAPAILDAEPEEEEEATAETTRVPISCNGGYDNDSERIWPASYDLIGEKSGGLSIIRPNSRGTSSL